MPAKSDKQQRFAAMSRTPQGRRQLRASGKKPMPMDVAHDFAHKVATAFDGKQGQGGRG